MFTLHSNGRKLEAYLALDLAILEAARLSRCVDCDKVIILSAHTGEVIASFTDGIITMMSSSIHYDY